eukprot:GFYU01036035.1.p1 GENE.GFYU01036035.1~~GFYU01036035.1.p1  ORF type:complete len:121 (-),score=11.02 GFYU01036035.1:252-614(-)
MASITAPTYIPQRSTGSNHKFVTLNCKLAFPHHPFLNYKLKLPTSSTVFEVANKILEKQGGRLSDLRMYLHQVHPLNQLTDMMKTLESLNVEGEEVKEAKEIDLFYELDSAPVADPILNF